MSQISTSEPEEPAVCWVLGVQLTMLSVRQRLSSFNQYKVAIHKRYCSQIMFDHHMKKETQWWVSSQFNPRKSWWVYSCIMYGHPGGRGCGNDTQIPDPKFWGLSIKSPCPSFSKCFVLLPWALFATLLFSLFTVLHTLVNSQYYLVVCEIPCSINSLC